MAQARGIRIEKFKSQEKINALTFSQKEMEEWRELANQFISQGYYETKVYDDEYLKCLRSNGLKN